MLNLLWGAMMLIGILYGAVTGRLSEVTDAALSCAKEAVALCITMWNCSDVDGNHADCEKLD